MKYQIFKLSDPLKVIKTIESTIESSFRRMGLSESSARIAAKGR